MAGSLHFLLGSSAFGDCEITSAWQLGSIELHKYITSTGRRYIMLSQTKIPSAACDGISIESIIASVSSNAGTIDMRRRKRLASSRYNRESLLIQRIPPTNHVTPPTHAEVPPHTSPPPPAPQQPPPYTKYAPRPSDQALPNTPLSHSNTPPQSRDA